MYKIYLNIILTVFLVRNQGFCSEAPLLTEARSPSTHHSLTTAAAGGSAILSSAKIPFYLRKVYSFLSLEQFYSMLEAKPKPSRLGLVVSFFEAVEGDQLIKMEAYVKRALAISKPEDVSNYWLPFSYLYDTHPDWLLPVIQEEVQRLRALVGSERLITMIQSTNEGVGAPSGPRELLEKLLYEARLSGLRHLLDRDWEFLYYKLWVERNFYGDSHVREGFGDIIDLMESEEKIFDPSLTRPCTEQGFFKAAEVCRSYSGQSVLIVGGGKAIGSSTGEEERRKPEVFYSVNIMKNQDPDLLADINVPGQIAFLPSKSFDRIRTDHVPVECYWCDSFFQSANRLLKIGGQLDIQLRVEEKITLEAANERLGQFGFEYIKIGPSIVYKKIRDIG